MIAGLRRSWHRLQGALPSGTARVGVGLAVLGASAYVFLVLAGRALGPAGFGAVSSLYVMVYALGPGLFLPLEQEVGRVVATRHAAGVGGAGPVARRAALLAFGVLGAVLLLLAANAQRLANEVFDGSVLLVIALGLALTALCAAHLTRGVLAGAGRFGTYSIQLGLEGALRVVLSLVLLAFAVNTAEPYGMLIAVAPAVAVLLTSAPLRRHLEPGPPLRWSELSSAMGWLVAASLLAQVLVNAGPVLVQVLATTSEREAAGRFIAAFVFARVPLFIFAAVQATLLPGLARALGSGDRQRFRQDLRRVLAAVLALGAGGVLVSAALGPQAVAILFGASFRLERRDLTLLALSTACYLVAVVLQPGLVALERHFDVALGWTAGTVVLGLMCIPPAPVLFRVERALLVGTASAAVLLAILLRRALADSETAPAEPVVR